MELLTHPFSLGLILGLVFTLLALVRLFGVKSEFRRYKQHLSDRMQTEADHLQRERAELTDLRQQNENLRLKISQLTQAPDRRAARELDILLRSEKSMTISAPGFAAAWEKANAEAIREVEEEEAGRSLPRRMITKIFGSSTKAVALSDSDRVDF